MRPGRFNRSNFSLKPRAKARRLFRVDHGRRHHRIAFQMNAAADDRIPPRRLFTFLIMVFGMFMSILDIQVVSASPARRACREHREHGAI